MFHTFTQGSTSFAGAGASEPLYFDNDGQPVFAHMVSAPHANKHLIKFPIALDHTTLRSRTGNSTTPPQMVLLKADTGANVNLMNRQTFNQLFGKAKDMLQLTPIRMENYRNTAVKVLRMFHAFLRWKDKVYKQLLLKVNEVFFQYSDGGQWKGLPMAPLSPRDVTSCHMELFTFSRQCSQHC